MAGKEDRGPGLVELDEQIPDIADATRIEAVGRFVEDEKLRNTYQGGGEPEALPHAERVGAHGPPVDVREADALQRLADPPAPRPSTPRRPGGVKQRQVGPSGQVRIGGGLLDERADLGQHPSSGLRHGQAHDLDLTARRVDEAEQHPDQRCLAGAVRPEQAVAVTVPHDDVGGVDRDDLAEALGESPSDDQGHGPVSCSTAAAACASSCGLARPAIRNVSKDAYGCTRTTVISGVAICTPNPFAKVNGVPPLF